MDIQKIAQCLFSKWNHTIPLQSAKEEMQHLLSRQKPLRIYHDLQHRLRTGGDKNVPIETFLITCALFCRAQEDKHEISAAICKYGMEKMLFVGFSIFLNNKKSTYNLTVSWSDYHFPNKHAWLSSFTGDFRTGKYQELFSVASLLHEFDQDRFWQIAKEDSNDLILLNWYDIFWELPPHSRALELFAKGQSIRHNALAFWWMTLSIQPSPNGEIQAHSILSELETVPENILVSRIYEFMLSEPFLPKAFRDYLISPSRDALLRREFMRADLISDWRHILILSELVHKIPSLRLQNFYWRSIVTCIAEKVTTGKLPYGAESVEKALSSLPSKHLKQLQNILSSYSDTLHVQQIDSILRPEIFYHDSHINTAIQHILSYSAVT